MEWTATRKWLVRDLLDKEIARIKAKAPNDRSDPELYWLPELKAALNDLGGTTWVVLKPRQERK